MNSSLSGNVESIYSCLVEALESAGYSYAYTGKQSVTYRKTIDADNYRVSSIVLMKKTPIGDSSGSSTAPRDGFLTLFRPSAVLSRLGPFKFLDSLMFSSPSSSFASSLMNPPLRCIERGWRWYIGLGPPLSLRLLSSASRLFSL